MILVSFAPMHQILVKRTGLVASPNFKITQIDLPLYFLGFLAYAFIEDFNSLQNLEAVLNCSCLDSRVTRQGQTWLTDGSSFGTFPDFFQIKDE